ncbi:hypothetical protein H0E87_029422 [Populus deltoides]|uniref:Uncharacterized protein n=1 Tax=Populus deltoides TaxID=3696 RepID=A0A8T2WQF6_POPDE|nr:hypothetical protein H0E87_029422 [Populus deltoides]
MITQSCKDSLDMISVNDFRGLERIPAVMNELGYEVGDEHGQGPVVSKQRRIIVANQLPIRGYRNEGTKGWFFEFDKDSLVLQLKDGFPANTEVWYVGMLKVDVEKEDQEEVAQLMFHKFRCVPVFLTVDQKNKYYHGFCKHYLWPLFHYMLPLSPSHGGVRFDKSLWEGYIVANQLFANKVAEILWPDKDSVWVHDYHLMVLPSILRNRYTRVKLGFFLHSPFPSSEIYRTIPVREQILRSLLNCDLIGFHTFDYARHFLSCCSRLLGIDYQCKRGYIGLDYCGKTINIKILPVGIHMGQLESDLNMEQTATLAKQLKERFEGKVVMVGVDDLDMFKGISLKFSAMGRLLEMHPELIGSVVLVQIANPARSRGKDVQEVRFETSVIAQQINNKYGKEGYEPIVFINDPLSALEKAAYYAISECCVVNAVRDGMNLVSYKYTVCRQGSPVLDKALGINESDQRKSFLIVSEFIGCSPSLSGAYRVNPWDVNAVADAMYVGIHMKDEEKHLRHEKHYNYISSHDVAFWARSFDQDLDRACKRASSQEGVSKGVVVEDLISSMRSKGKSPDFLFCIGDDRSDEDMFESIARLFDNPSLPPIAEVFACTVGHKPSKAKYYLDDTPDVIELLQGLAAASVGP